jgi:hypothetical protein
MLKHRNAIMQSTRYSCRIFMKLELYRQIFERRSKIKFHKKKVGAETDMTKLITAFRNFANAPKNVQFLVMELSPSSHDRTSSPAPCSQTLSTIHKQVCYQSSQRLGKTLLQPLWVTSNRADTALQRHI